MCVLNIEEEVRVVWFGVYRTTNRTAGSLTDPSYIALIREGAENFIAESISTRSIHIFFLSTQNWLSFIADYVAGLHIVRVPDPLALRITQSRNLATD